MNVEELILSILAAKPKINEPRQSMTALAFWLFRAVVPYARVPAATTGPVLFPEPWAMYFQKLQRILASA